jgi:hypothetical protein
VDLNGEIKALSWTLAATAITLWTLSGSTRKAGIIITIVTLVIYIVATLLQKDK